MTLDVYSPNIFSFAPVICGFINDGAGYRWVFYVPAIFLGAAFLFLFFFMEETNYDGRAPDGVQHYHDQEQKDPDALPSDAGHSLRKKTYLQKLALKDRSTLR